MLEIRPMNDESLVWQKEIEDLSKENGVQCLAFVLGISEGEAADKFLEHKITPKDGGFGQVITIAKVLGTELHTASLRSTYRTGISSHIEFADSFPTILQWLIDNKGPAILRTGNGFVYVELGIVIANWGVNMLLGTKVTHVIYLDGEEG